MSLHTLARAAYGRKDGAGRSPRSIEYDLFAQHTGRLAAAWQARDHDHASLVRALYDNNRLWRKLALDLSSDRNGLPPLLRARLLSLSQFTSRYSRDVAKGQGSAEVLVDINTAVMRGLRGEVEPVAQRGQG